MSAIVSSKRGDGLVAVGGSVATSSSIGATFTLFFVGWDFFLWLALSSLNALL